MKLSLTEFGRADEYRPGERIASRLTRRAGTICAWPEGTPRPKEHGEIWGVVWVQWDDGRVGHAWRHQIHRI